MAIVPPPSTTDKEPEALYAQPVLSLWVRGTLVGIALGLVVLFAVAAALNPYQGDGSARRLETHRQLGLPECTFKRLTGYPCPSCGMTTSFALTVRGDLINAFQANSVGELLALFLLALIPWCVGSAVCRRLVFVRSIERTVMYVVFALLGLMLLRWGLFVGLMHWTGAAPRF